MLVGLAQIDSVIGDFDGNREKMLSIAEASASGSRPASATCHVTRASVTLLRATSIMRGERSTATTRPAGDNRASSARVRLPVPQPTSSTVSSPSRSSAAIRPPLV